MAEYIPSPLEEMLCRSDLFALQSASPAQRAYCRIADGYPLLQLWDYPAVQALCGGHKPRAYRPELVMLIVAIRSGKSLIASALAVCDALSADLRRVQPGELGARIGIISTTRDAANAVFQHLIGHVRNSPVLSTLVVGAPTTDTLTLRRDIQIDGSPGDGKEVEIKVLAMSRAGSSLATRWMAGAVIDECTLMLGEDDSAKSLDDSLKSLEGRMLPGARITMIGSTVAPPSGPAYDRLIALFGKGVRNKEIALWSTGPEFNPSYYTEDYCKKLRAKSLPHYRAATERCFMDPETGFLSTDLIASCTPEQPPTAPTHVPAWCTYVAAIDPATRKNGWALVVVENIGGFPEKFRIALVHEWQAQAGQKLSPAHVLEEISKMLRPYGIDLIHSDEYMADALNDLAQPYGLAVLAKNMVGVEARDGYLQLAGLLADQLLELHPHPLLQRDLRAVRKRVNQDGTVSFLLPRTPDGRHCDTIPALLKCILNPPPAPEQAAPEYTEQDELEEIFGRLMKQNREALWEDLC